MPRKLVFCTSRSVTPDLVNQLNKDCGYDKFAPPRSTDLNTFAPCPVSMEQDIRIAGKYEDLDYFEDHSPEDLQQVVQERCKNGKSIDVYKLKYAFDDFDEIIGDYWVSWRVRFDESFILVALLETKEEFYDTVFSKWDRFVGEDGIFPVNAAMKQVEEEELVAAREH